MRELDRLKCIQAVASEGTASNQCETWRRLTQDSNRRLAYEKQ